MDTLLIRTLSMASSVVWLSNFLVCRHRNYKKWKWKIFGHSLNTKLKGYKNKKCLPSAAVEVRWKKNFISSLKGIENKYVKKTSHWFMYKIQHKLINLYNFT